MFFSDICAAHLQTASFLGSKVAVKSSSNSSLCVTALPEEVISLSLLNTWVVEKAHWLSVYSDNLSFLLFTCFSQHH